MSVFLGRRKPGSSWTALDTTAALAWQAYEDSLCPGCGQPRHESMDGSAEGAYVAPPPMVCHACDRIGKAREAWRAEWRRIKADPPSGRYWSVERKRT